MERIGGLEKNPSLGLKSFHKMSLRKKTTLRMSNAGSGRIANK